MPIGSKGVESSLHDAEGETRHPIIPCGAHHPLPPDLFDLHARTTNAKTNAMSPTPHMGERETRKKRFPRGFCRRRHFAERLAHLSEHGAVERGRPQRWRWWPRCRLRVRPSIRVGLLARPRLRRRGRPRERGQHLLHSPNRRQWRRSRARRPEKWQFTQGPAPAQRTEPTARFLLEG